MNLNFLSAISVLAFSPVIHPVPDHSLANRLDITLNQFLSGTFDYKAASARH